VTTQRTGPLVCVGDLMLDVLITTGRLEDGMPDGIYVRPGGSAANVAAWAVESGCASAWMGDVGSDTVGDMLLEDLRKSGIGAFMCRKPGLESGVVLSWIGRRGNRTMHSARWAATAFAIDSLPLADLCGARAVHVTGYAGHTEPGLTALEAVFRAAKSRGAFLSFDPSHAGLVRSVGSQRLRDLLGDSKVDVIFANRSETAALTGSASARESARILAQSLPLAIVKDGGRGCYAARAGVLQHFPAVRVQPVDTTGAGDAFAGSWLAHFLQHGDAAEACRHATAAAARAIQSIGARPATSS
jgi:ribokinase